MKCKLIKEEIPEVNNKEQESDRFLAILVSPAISQPDIIVLFNQEQEAKNILP